jgi:hypothetical protein
MATSRDPHERALAFPRHKHKKESRCKGGHGHAVAHSKNAKDLDGCSFKPTPDLTQAPFWIRIQLIT